MKTGVPIDRARRADPDGRRPVQSGRARDMLDHAMDRRDRAVVVTLRCGDPLASDDLAIDECDRFDLRAAKVDADSSAVNGRVSMRDSPRRARRGTEGHGDFLEGWGGGDRRGPE